MFCVLDEVSALQAVEGDPLYVKCDYPEDVEITKTQCAKESDDDAHFSPPSKKSQWLYV